jgi:signal transduction histidine kinase/HAMP domain-containing protein
MSLRILDISGQEVFGVDLRDGNAADTARAELENQADQSYFIETLRLAPQVHISDIELNASHRQIETPYMPIIRFSLPLYAEGGGIAGVIALKARAQPMLAAPSPVAADSIFYIIDDNGNYLSHPDASKLYGDILRTGSSFARERPNDNVVIRSANQGTVFSALDSPDVLQSYVRVDLPNRDDVHWTFIFEEKQSKILSEINNARLVTIGLAGLALVVALGLAWLITRNIVLPVQQLARVSAAISRGEWDVAIPSARSGDEISRLAVAFERMSKELRTLYANLEMRVVARTSELETVAKVSGAAAAILDLEKLLDTVSDLTKTSFALSKVQVHLLDEPSQRLIQSSNLDGRGELHSIPLDSTESIVAQAGQDRRGITVSDARQQNGASPSGMTGSELAVPLKVANRLLGVLDLHSEQMDRFTESELRVMTILADQIAVAVQNAYLYRDQLESARQLAIERQRADEANKAKSLFLSNVSHELRTPLNIVIGYTSSMLERPAMYDNIPLPVVYANDIELIRENGYHLIGLINDILDLSKIEAGRLELQREPISLLDIFRGVLATAVGLVKDKPVLIRSDIPDQLPLVRADPTRVRQIILNLMSNAVKFTERGSVTLRACTEDGFVKIAVIDTGIGIPENALPHIFDRFRQGDHNTSRRYGGTGLGLDISKQLCQMHGGDLTVKSVYGEGSTFTFTLPVMAPEHSQVGPATGPEANGASKTSQVFSRTGKPIRPVTQTVVLVEAEVSTADSLRRTLENAGYLVFLTHEGAEALETALGVIPDAIVLDMPLPDVDGWEVLAALKRDAEISAAPVIVCSADPAENATNRGAARVVRKPFTAQDILDAVQREIAGSSLPGGS